MINNARKGKKFFLKEQLKNDNLLDKTKNGEKNINSSEQENINSVENTENKDKLNENNNEKNQENKEINETEKKEEE